MFASAASPRVCDFKRTRWLSDETRLARRRRGGRGARRGVSCCQRYSQCRVVTRAAFDGGRQLTKKLALIIDWTINGAIRRVCVSPRT